MSKIFLPERIFQLEREKKKKAQPIYSLVMSRSRPDNSTSIDVCNNSTRRVGQEYFFVLSETTYK